MATRKQTHQIAIRYDDAEWAQLEAAAGDTGLSVPAYVKLRSLGPALNPESATENGTKDLVALSPVPKLAALWGEAEELFRAVYREQQEFRRRRAQMWDEPARELDPEWERAHEWEMVLKNDDEDYYGDLVA